MERYRPGSRTSRHAGRRYCNRPRAALAPAAADLGSWPLADPAIAPGTGWTVPARHRQARPDGQPLVSKTKSSRFSFGLLAARQTTMRCGSDDTRPRLTPDRRYSWSELIVIAALSLPPSACRGRLSPSRPHPGEAAPGRWAAQRNFSADERKTVTVACR